MSVFDFAVDFGLTFFKDSSNKSTVTRKQYRTESVDFYNQSLEASTGIDVDTSAEAKEDKEEEEESININRIGSPNDLGEDLGFQYDFGKIQNNTFTAGTNNTPTDLLARTPTTYGEQLTKSGFKERAAVNFLGTDYYYAGVPTTLKGAKEQAKEGLFSWETVAKGVGKAAGFSNMGMGFVLGLAKGRPVNDAFGNATFRPSHAIAGAIFDTMQSMQYADVAINQAALASYTGSGMSNQFSPTTGYDHVSGRATGFNGYVNGLLVTREAGKSGYTGGSADMDYQVTKGIEAMSKGYIPSTYNIQNETGERGATPINKQGGFYTERGSYAWAGGTAAGGWMSDLEDLTAHHYGKGMVNAASKGVISKSLQQARDQYNWWGGKKDAKNTKTLSFIIAENIRTSQGITTPAQAIKDKAFKSTDPRSSYFKNRRTQEFGKNKVEKEAEEKKQADAIAVAEKKSLAKYREMVKRQQKNKGQYTKSENDNNDGSQDTSDQASVADQQGGLFTAKGGFVSKGNFALGGEAEPAGFIGGRPEQFDDQTTIADDIPLKVKDGTFVINAPAVEYAGSIDVQKMLSEGYEKAMTRDIGVDKSFKIGKIPSIEELDIQISRGEVVVPPHVARVIGYDRLEKINNRGKREVERRQKAGNQEKVQAGQGFAATGGEQGLLFRRPNLKLTSPNIDKYQDSFVPGISDKPVEMGLNDQTFFGDFTFGDIKKAIKKTEIQGFEKNPYIFTGVKPKKGKSSSAFGPMQITTSLIKDFKKRSPNYKTLNKEEKNYLESLSLQGTDKINKELYGVVLRGAKPNRIEYKPSKIHGKKEKNLKAYGAGVIDPKQHKKYYEKIADVILLHKLSDHTDIKKALASYGEGLNYSEKVYNDLLDFTQIKSLDKN